MPQENALDHAISFADLCAETPPKTVTFDDLCTVTFEDLCVEETPPAISFADLLQDAAQKEQLQDMIREKLEVMAAKTVLNNIAASEKQGVQEFFDTIIDLGGYHDDLLYVIDSKEGDPEFERHFKKAMNRMNYAWPANAQEATFILIKDIMTSIEQGLIEPIEGSEALYTEIDYAVWTEGHNIIFEPRSGLKEFGIATVSWRDLHNLENDDLSIDWNKQQIQHKADIKQAAEIWLKSFKNQKNFTSPSQRPDQT